VTKLLPAMLSCLLRMRNRKPYLLVLPAACVWLAKRSCRADEVFRELLGIISSRITAHHQKDPPGERVLVQLYMIHSENLTPVGDVYVMMAVPWEIAQANPVWLT
jgi:hypothetical protein